MKKSPTSIYAKSLDALRENCAEAPFVASSFERYIERCDPAECLGMCCYDGVYIDAGTEDALAALVSDRRGDLEGIGAILPEAIFEDGTFNGEMLGRKTATRPFAYDGKVADFPGHFEQTACVFLIDDGRCSLQALAIADGRHPWDYKPPTCWVHPIKVSASGIVLHDEDDDPHVLPEYPGYVSRTRCGGCSGCGDPARTVLADELEYLATILDRRW